MSVALTVGMRHSGLSPQQILLNAAQSRLVTTERVEYLDDYSGSRPTELRTINECLLKFGVRSCVKFECLLNITENMFLPGDVMICGKDFDAGFYWRVDSLFRLQIRLKTLESLIQRFEKPDIFAGVLNIIYKAFASSVSPSGLDVAMYYEQGWASPLGSIMVYCGRADKIASELLGAFVEFNPERRPLILEAIKPATIDPDVLGLPYLNSAQAPPAAYYTQFQNRVSPPHTLAEFLPGIRLETLRRLMTRPDRYVGSLVRMPSDSAVAMQHIITKSDLLIGVSRLSLDPLVSIWPILANALEALDQEWNDW